MSGTMPFVSMYREVRDMRLADMTRDDVNRMHEYERQCVSRTRGLNRVLRTSTDDNQVVAAEEELDDITILLAMIRLKAWQFVFPQQRIPHQLLADIYPGYIERFED